MERAEKGGEKLKRKILVFTLLLLLISALVPTTISMFVATSTPPADIKLDTMSDSLNSTFSIMQISDTQHLAMLSPALYNDTTSWIVNNSANYNLQMVIHTGDFIDAFSAAPLTIYNDSQKNQEWAVANTSISKLLNAGIPYCWCVGNHDQTPFSNSNGTSIAANYTAFNTTYLSSKSYWAGDTYDSKNTAVKFTVKNYPFLIIDLEYLANNSVLAWMKGLLDKSTNVNVIIATHGYLDSNGKYDASSATVGAWTKNFKTTLDNYPNVFLALCGHNHGWNMTKSGNRQEILFDFQEENNLTGAAVARIYTFNLTNKQVYAQTYCIDNRTWLTDAYNQFSFVASLTSDWTLVNDARAVKAYPDLQEYVWQKDAIMQPNGQYDKIGLHRLVKTGITPIGVIFMTDCPMWGAGEQHISNPPTDNWTKYENYSSAIYWANRGFDVYAIDYRTHFVPKDLNSSQMSFAANWGWDVWISDIKEAANKVKEVSGSQKFYIEGQCSGGEAALNYATKYWKDDLAGIILLDANYPGASGYPIVGRINETNTYNMTKAISNMNSAGNWSYDPFRTLRPIANYALQNPNAPAAYPPGTPLNPPINPTTNKTWANITEWFTWLMQYNFGVATTPPGSTSNLLGGYGNISQDEFCLANNELLPTRLFIENAAMADWVNSPDLSYDFNDHYNEVGVPVLAFEGPFVNTTGKFRFVQGTNNTDFTGIYMPMYGHLDIFFGTYSARDVSEPAYQWMVNHLPRALFGNTAIGTLYDQNDANAQSISYFTCTKSGIITDIRAYIDGASAGNCVAAIYSVSEGSVSILLGQSKPVSIGTSFSWVDFQLPGPLHVSAGTTYGLAVMGDVPVSVMEVDGTGQRDHNAVSSYANGFANPFGPIWGTDDRGAMSIYAFAISTNEEHVDIGGVSIIDVPGHPNILITASHMDRSNFYSGSAVRIMLFVSTAPSGIGPPFKFVVAYENNPERYAFSQQVGGSIQLLNLVKIDQIQVLGKDKTALVYWTVPLTVPGTTVNPFGAATPAVTIPPGWLLLQGYGDTHSNVQSTTYPSLWTWNYQTTVYNAKSTIICPDWQYFGPVSETGTSPTIVTEAINNWTHP